MSRISEKQLLAKILNHNAWHKVKLDTDALGASGGMGEHLIIRGTQTKLTVLMTKSELWDAINIIQNYESASNHSLKTPDKEWMKRYLTLKEEMEAEN